MKLPALTHDPKKRFLIGLGVGIVVICVFIFLSAVPLINRQTSLKKELKELEEKVDMANKVVQVGNEIRAERETIVDRLRQMFGNDIPPSDNSLLWATKEIYECARPAGVEIDEITEINSGPPPWQKKRKAKLTPEEAAAARSKQRKFAPYAVQVMLRCGFFGLVDMVDRLEQNPFASVSSIAIAAESRNPEQHKIRLLIEWIRYTGEPLKELAEEELQ